MGAQTLPQEQQGAVALHREPVIIIDDDKSIAKTLKLHFERLGYDVETANTAYDGLALLAGAPVAIVILDIRLPDANGVELLKDIRKSGENYYTIIITAFPDMDSTVKAVQNGVGDYIHKPIDIEEITAAVEKAEEFFQCRDAEESAFIPIPNLSAFGAHFIGKSKAMKEVFKVVGHVSMSKAIAHITGESGTGKELVAKAIHQNSPERNEPFISVNCSAIVDTLLESELFGHEKGAFTGAIAQKEGKFSLARHGTIFLDEIGEMDINLQAKLLRVLQEREFERVGGNEKLKCHCRIISATNRDLEEMVRQGGFRKDLYYRLKVIQIHLPPLRERREDIPILAQYFVAKANRDANQNIRYISREALEYLSRLTWTGNVRQLENVITHAVIMNAGERLTEKTFMSVIRREDTERSLDDPAPPSAPPREYTPKSLAEMEHEQIQQALAYTHWHKGRACEILGITRPRLERKIRKFGIKPSHYYLEGH